MPGTTSEIEATEIEATVDSPLGPIRLAVRDGAVVRLRWHPEAAETATGKTSGGKTSDLPDNDLIRETVDQLADYFAGRRAEFDLPVNPAGTGFQRNVWTIMQNIPNGRVRTYGDVAEELGASARAVGTACGANPIPVIIPCHRIVAANGRLGGFSAARGVEDKVWLLRHERVLL